MWPRWGAGMLRTVRREGVWVVEERRRAEEGGMWRRKWARRMDGRGGCGRIVKRGRGRGARGVATGAFDQFFKVFTSGVEGNQVVRNVHATSAG